MRGLLLLALIPCIVVVPACSPNSAVQGRKLSQWVKQLDDRDQDTQEAGLAAIACFKPIRIIDCARQSRDSDTRDLSVITAGRIG